MSLRRTFSAVVVIGVAVTELLAQGHWIRKANLPTARSALAVCAVEGKIYAMGGCPRSEVVYSAVEQYDPATDLWLRKADMPTPTCFFGAVVVKGKIYAIGGLAPDHTGLSVVEEYDPAVDTWRTRAPLPTARAFLSCGDADGRIYAIGGVANAGWEPALSTVEEYDPKPVVPTR